MAAGVVALPPVVGPRVEAEVKLNHDEMMALARYEDHRPRSAYRWWVDIPNIGCDRCNLYVYQEHITQIEFGYENYKRYCDDCMKKLWPDVRPELSRSSPERRWWRRRK